MHFLLEDDIQDKPRPQYENNRQSLHELISPNHKQTYNHRWIPYQMVNRLAKQQDVLHLMFDTVVKFQVIRHGLLQYKINGEQLKYSFVFATILPFPVCLRVWN